MSDLRVRVKFEPRDLWIGAYWEPAGREFRNRLFVCIVPTLPIIISWRPR